ncbi:MAG TPA: hypothetical protein VJB82_00175 [Candidatus Peribacterales bacterium]|nr:hypothetical protein [Candidatus Peribacterales bacterium]
MSTVALDGIGGVASDAYRSEVLTGIPLPEWETMSPPELHAALQYSAENQGRIHALMEALMKATTMTGYKPEYCDLQHKLQNAKRELEVALLAGAPDGAVSDQATRAATSIREVFRTLSFAESFPQNKSPQRRHGSNWRERISSFFNGELLQDLRAMFAAPSKIEYEEV